MTKTNLAPGNFHKFLFRITIEITNCLDKEKYSYFLFCCTQPKVTNFSFITLLKQEKLRKKLHVFREGSSLNLFSLNLLTENSNATIKNWPKVEKRGIQILNANDTDNKALRSSLI